MAWIKRRKFGKYFLWGGLFFTSLSPVKTQRLRTEIRREAALSKREIRHTVAFRDGKNTRNPHMIGFILSGRTEASTFCRKNAVWVGSGWLREVRKLLLPPRNPDSEPRQDGGCWFRRYKKKVFFFFPARLWGEERRCRALTSWRQPAVSYRASCERTCGRLLVVQ